MTFSPSALVATLVAVAKADAAKTLLPLIADFTNSVAANPTQLNIVAQAAKFQVGLLTIVPGLEQAELVALATAINTEAQLLLA